MKPVGIYSEHFVVFVVLYSMIILTGLRAFIIIGDNYGIKDKWTVDYKDLTGLNANNELSFLDGFVFKDSDGPLKTEAASRDRKIAKRSISHSTVPRYMMDLYEHLSDKRLRVTFDTARSFRSTGSTPESVNLLKSRNTSNITSRKLTFNISSFPASEKIQFAQLRIQMQPEILIDKLDHKIKADIYSLFDEKQTMIGSREMDFTKTPLLTINVTASAHLAAESGKAEIAFAVAVPLDADDVFNWDLAGEESPQLLLLSKRSPKIQESEDSVFKRMKRSLYEKFEDSMLEEKAVTMIGNSSRDVNSSRVKRSEEEDEEAEEQSNYIVEELGRIRKGKLKKKKNPCRRKPLHISFAAINYDQWIIAPPSYEAFECTGRCSFPMSAHLTPTKHAIIQTLMHSLEPKQISRACCVPTKLDSISVLYIEDDGVVTYKYDYEDMVVAECGCR